MAKEKFEFIVDNSKEKSTLEDDYIDLDKANGKTVVAKKNTLFDKTLQAQKLAKERERLEILYGKKLIECVKGHFFRNDGKVVRILFLSPVWNKGTRGKMELVSLYSIEWEFDQETRAMRNLSHMSLFIPSVEAINVRPFGVKPRGTSEDELAESEEQIKQMISNKYIDYAYADSTEYTDKVLVFETREMADVFSDFIPFEDNLMMLLHDIIPLADLASVINGKNFSNLRHMIEEYHVDGKIENPAERVKIMTKIFVKQLKLIQQMR